MTDLISSIGNVVSIIANNTFLGKIWVWLSSLAIAYFTPIAGLLFACFVFNIIDLFYGLKVAKQAGKKLTSSKSWKGTIRKIKDEFIIIMLGHLLEHVMGVSSITLLSGGATVLICITEIWSIIENLNTIDPEGPWRILGKYLRKKGSDLTGVSITVTKDGKLDVETNVDIDVDEKA